MRTLHDWIAGLEGWRRWGVAFILGALAAAALPPLHLVPVLIPSFTALVWLLAARRGARPAFAMGWWFGFGHLVAGLYWIGHAFLVDAGRFGWMMPMAVAGLCAGLALYPALAALVARALTRSHLGLALVLPAAWIGGEWLRGHLLTGFPWNALGYVWTFSDAMLQPLAVTGIYGLGFATALAAAMPAVFATAAPRRRAPLLVALAVVPLAAALAGGLLRLNAASVEAVPGVRLRLVQANIPQAQKWLPSERQAGLLRHLQLSSEPGMESVTHFVWPETAIPYFVDESAEIRDLVGGIAPRGGLVFAGAPRRKHGADGGLRLWNSIHALDSSGVVASYDKKHLVPFGEYLPWRGFLSALGIAKLTIGAIDFSVGEGARVLSLPGLPPVAPLICYEVIFPDEIARGGRPEWLLNLTNDAWFGISSGPYQHLAMARARAVELGVPLVRAASTGISAVTDPYGRIVVSLALDTAGTVDSPLPKALSEAPLYARLGDWPALGLVMAVLALAVFRRFRVGASDE